MHLLSIGGVDISGRAPYIWLLHLGVFIVWIPVVLYLRKDEEFKAQQPSGLKGRKPFGFFKIIFKNAPLWLKIVAITGFYYAIVNFIFFAISQHGSPDIVDGHFVLQNHGQSVRTLTEKEYHHYKANEVRGFSGHWIAFYGIAMAVLFPADKTVGGS